MSLLRDSGVPGTLRLGCAPGRHPFLGRAEPADGATGVGEQRHRTTAPLLVFQEGQGIDVDAAVPNGKVQMHP